MGAKTLVPQNDKDKMGARLDYLNKILGNGVQSLVLCYLISVSGTVVSINCKTFRIHIVWHYPIQFQTQQVITRNSCAGFKSVES